MTDREREIRGRLLELQTEMTSFSTDPHRPRHKDIPNAHLRSMLAHERQRLRLELLEIITNASKEADNAKD